MLICSPPYALRLSQIHPLKRNCLGYEGPRMPGRCILWKLKMAVVLSDCIKLKGIMWN